MIEPMFAQVQEMIARIGRIDPPTPDIDIFEAGFASVDALELLIELEETFQVTIPDDRYVTVRTVDGLVTLISELQRVNLP